MRKILAITTVIGLITVAMINIQCYDLNADVQDITQLSSGVIEETLNFPDNSETRIINVTLPKNATVTKAIVNLTGYPILNAIEPTLLSVISNDINDQDSFDPEMVMTQNETLHVVWVDDGPIIGNDNDNDIYYNHKPKGQSWNNIILISDASPNSNSIEPTMTTNMQNNTCIAWADDSNYGGSGNDNDILLKNCTSGVWGTISVISDDLNDGDSLNPQIAADVQGNLHLVWADDGNLASSGNDYDIVYRKYNASSKSWEAPIIISDGNNDGASLNPSILHLNNYIHIAWEDNSDINLSGSDNDILYRYWNATAGSWSGTFVISDDTNDGESYNASISGNEDGELFIGWQDDGNIDNSGTDIDAVYKIWSPGLGAWSTTNVLSTELNSNNALNPIMYSGLFGNLHGIWSDNGNINNSGSDDDIIHKRFDGITNNYTAPLIISNDNNDGNSTNPKMLIRTGKRSEHFHNLWVDDGNIANSGLDRDIVYTSYSFNYSYPSNLKLDVGNNNGWDWSYNGEINTTMTIGDTVTNKWFSEILNSIITNNTNFDPPPELIVPLKFYSATPGYLQIQDLKITYTLTPDPPTNLTLPSEKDDWHLVDNIPTFSWEFNDMDSQTQGWFELKVGTSPGNNDMWDPSPVQTSETTITYGGAELLDGETYYFKVRTKDNDGSRWGAWSENKIFRFNTAPNVISLEPTNGTYIHSINLTWSTEDDEFDVTNITIEAYFNGQWQELVNLTSASYFNWDVSSISPQEVDFRAKCWDGFEYSPGWFNPDSTILIFKNSEPVILLISPPPGEFEVNELIKIHWVIYDSDLDDIHTVDLYYDTDKDLGEKTLIKEGITDIDWYIWETVNIREGKYYICAVVHDESALNYTYSDGLIVVNHTIPRGPPPEISFVFPPDGSMDVPITTDIWVQFDNHIDPSSLSKSNFYVMDTAGNRILGKTIYDVEKKEARYNPELNLSYNETYIAIVVADVRDLEGNRLDGDGNGIADGSPFDDYVWFFRTKPLEGDVTPPQVVSTTPKAQETNVENFTIITITFSEAMDEASLENNIMIYNATFAFIEIKEIHYNEDTNTLTIILRDKLADNMTYTVLITADAKDSSGKNLDGNGNGASEGPPWDNYEFIFTTGEVIVPPEQPPPPPPNGTKKSENLILTYLPLIVVLIIILILVGISMIYRRHRQGKFIVNNILIIYNDGRLLTRYHRKSENAIDDSAVSSMLTAIQDFIRESFKESRKSVKSRKKEDSEPQEDKSSVDELKYGKMKILIEYDEKFYIAVIGEGKEVPPKLRKELKKIKSRINSKYDKVLEYWDGNMAPVKGMRNQLEPLMKE